MNHSGFILYLHKPGQNALPASVPINSLFFRKNIPTVSSCNGYSLM